MVNGTGIYNLYVDRQFAENKFLGHVFGFPIAPFTKQEFENYANKSIQMKKKIFYRSKCHI